jgi:putative nucleotidyltransferase with HDIG domain
MPIASRISGSSQRTGRSFLGPGPTLALTAAVALALVVLPLASKDVSDVPLLMFMLPVGLCAVRFGARGGLGAAALGTLLAAFWFLHGQHFASGLAEMLMHITVFALIGGLVGTVVDRKRKLEQAYRDELEQAVRDRTAELEDSRQETLRTLALAAEYRDDSTYQHTERVGRTAYLLARTLDLPEDAAALIRLAAPLHDIGKLGTPDQILLKPGTLTAAEFARVKEHTVDGAFILANSSSDVLRLAEQIALGHHEWWNGNGYPHGRKGDQIPLAARIVALADVFDALTHDRPYKRAWSVDEATIEINRLRGSQFDPAVVDAFNQLNPHELADRANPGPTEPRLTLITNAA